MGKVTYDIGNDTNPFEQWASQKKEAVATPDSTSETSGENPFLKWSQQPKKKSGGEESSTSLRESPDFTKPPPFPNTTTQTTEGNIRPIVFLDAKEINQAGRNYADGNLTAEDVGILSNTEFGKQKGFNNIPENARGIFADSYNISRKNNVTNSTLQVVNNYFPQIKGSLTQDGKDPDVLLNNFKSGDANAIKDFKQKTISQLQLQIKNLQQPVANAYRSATMPDVAVASEVNYASQNDAQIQALQGQIDNVESTLNKYALQSITAKYLKQANNKSAFVDFTSLGKEYHDYLGDKYTVQQEALASKSKKLEGEIARQNLSYRNESTGLNAVIDYNKIKAANNITKGLPSNDKVAIEDADKDLLNNEALQKSSDDILLRYPSVGVNFASRYLGDVIAEDKNFFVPYVSSKRVKEGIEKIQKDTPEVYSKYKTYFDYLAAHPTEVTEGGLSASFAKGMEGIGFDLASLFMSKEDKAAAEITRQNQANLQDTKFAQKNRIVYDNEGKAFREINDETYSPFNFNTSISVIGKGVPALIQWGALQEATAGTAGIFGAGEKAKDIIGLVGSTYMMDYAKNKSHADKLIDDDSTSGEFKRNIVANLLTLSTAAAMKVLNPADIVFQRSLTTSLSKDAVEYINKEGVEGLANQNKLLNWFKESATPRIVALAKSSGQNLYKGVEGGAAMVINNQFKDLVTVMANPDAQLTTGEENLHTFVETALTVIATGFPSMVKNGFSSSYKDMMYHAGLFPEEYIQRVNESLKSGKIDPKTANETISLIKTLGEEVSKVGFDKTKDGLPTIQRQKRDLAIANFRERAAQMLKEKGNQIDDAKISSEVKEEKDNVLKQNYTEPIEETAAFDELKSLNPQVKQFSDIDPSEKYEQYNDKGKLQKVSGADIIDSFQTKQDLNEVNEGKITTVNELLDRPVTYNNERGTLYQDGQRVIFQPKEKSKPEIELEGNIESIGNKSAKDLGIIKEESTVTIDDNGNINVRGKSYKPLESKPLNAINRDADGNVISVSLINENGNRRTFRGEVADDIAYQLTLKEKQNSSQSKIEQDGKNDNQEATLNAKSEAQSESNNNAAKGNEQGNGERGQEKNVSKQEGVGKPKNEQLNDKSTPSIESAVIEVNGKTYEGKNHAEAILKAKEDGQDISKINRQAEGKFLLSDGTIIDRTEAKKRFGADRSEQLIPQDEAAIKADKDYEKEKKAQVSNQEPMAGSEPSTGSAQEVKGTTQSETTRGNEEKQGVSKQEIKSIEDRFQKPLISGNRSISDLQKENKLEFIDLGDGLVAWKVPEDEKTTIQQYYLADVNGKSNTVHQLVQNAKGEFSRLNEPNIKLDANAFGENYESKLSRLNEAKNRLINKDQQSIPQQENITKVSLEKAETIFSSLDKADKKKSKEGINKAKSKIETEFGEEGKKARFIHDNFDEILKQLNIERKC